MPDELPKGWVKTTIGEVCALNPRPAYGELPPEITEVSFVPMASVEEESGRLDANQVRELAAVRKGYTPFKNNDVIFAKITPCMENGKIALATELKNGVAYGSTEFFVFRPYEGLLPRFVLHFLLQPSFRQEAERRMNGAVGQKRVPSNYLLAHPFALPPTQEQVRIVAKLDALLSLVVAGEAAARRALDRLQSYRDAVLHAAVTGELTGGRPKAHPARETGPQLLKRVLAERRERWEKDELNRLLAAGKPPTDDEWKQRYHEPASPQPTDLPGLPNGWVWTSPSQLSAGEKYALAIGPFGSNLKVSDYRNTGVPVIFVRNIRSEVFTNANTRYISHTKATQLIAHQVLGGDLLITKMGDPPGDACVYPESAPAAIITADCIRLRVSPLLSEVKQFFVYCINSPIAAIKSVA